MRGTVLVLALLLGAPSAYAQKAQKGGALREWRTRTSASVRRTLGKTGERLRSFGRRVPEPAKVALLFAGVGAAFEVAQPGSHMLLLHSLKALTVEQPISTALGVGIASLSFIRLAARRRAALRAVPEPIPVTPSTHPK